jgi:hypothetical protein
MADKKKKKKEEEAEGLDAGLALNDLNETLTGAISESHDPNARLKKLKSPINFWSCLLNMVFLLVGTIAIGLLVCSFLIDDFNLWVVFLDVMEKFGISGFFGRIGSWIGGLFGGGS